MRIARRRRVWLAVLPLAFAAACSSSSTTRNPDAGLDAIDAADTSVVGLDGAGRDTGTEGETPATNPVTVAPTSIELGLLQPGVASPAQTITITATDTVRDLTVSLSSGNLTLRRNTCGKTLAQGTSCVVTVAFVAASLGVKHESVLIVADGQPTTVTISATASSGGTLAISPSGTQAFLTGVGMSSTPITFGVANPSEMTVGPVAVTLSGPDASDFAITANDCDVLAPLAGCAFAVVFRPSTIGAKIATLIVTVPQFGVGGASIPLSGSGFSGAHPILTPTTGDLGSVAVGATGPSMTFTLTNTSDAAVTISTVALSSTEFVLTADLCTGMTVPARSGTCTIAVALRPVSVGAKTATLTIDSPTTEPALKMLTGTGVSPIDGGVDGGIAGGIDAYQDAPLDTAMDQQPGEAGIAGLDSSAG